MLRPAFHAIVELVTSSHLGEPYIDLLFGLDVSLTRSTDHYFVAFNSHTAMPTISSVYTEVFLELIFKQKHMNHQDNSCAIGK